MYKKLSIISVIFISSCFSSNNIVIDENDINKNNNLSAEANDNPFSIDKVLKDKEIKVTEAVISERKIITRNDKDFIISDISGNINNLDFNYQHSGVSKFSSPIAIKKVASFKEASPEIVFVLYFDFNSAKLSEYNQKMIALHANFIQNNTDISLVLNGHTDIKGSREYNLSLGENRGLSAKKALNLDINTAKKITIVSFGEEKTTSTADDKNRRVEFIYK